MQQYLKRTPGGLVLRNYVRRLTPDLFTHENDHNPLVARHCQKCNGNGFYRIGQGIQRHDESCSDCNHIGGFEDPVPFFASQASPFNVAPNKAGSLQCPSCQRIFPITSNQYWSGLRHSCGQKISLTGAYASMCWRRRHDSLHSINVVQFPTKRPWWRAW
ncbi:hypothetical protein H1235_10215 [Pseudoxanthomonas sp. NC8]|nr:hypothetical protein H1235_10215 [Pseudoxanthomonas sp. NC8]